MLQAAHAQLCVFVQEAALRIHRQIGAVDQLVGRHDAERHTVQLFQRRGLALVGHPALVRKHLPERRADLLGQLRQIGADVVRHEEGHVGVFLRHAQQASGADHLALIAEVQRFHRGLRAVRFIQAGGCLIVQIVAGLCRRVDHDVSLQHGQVFRRIQLVKLLEILWEIGADAALRDLIGVQQLPQREIFAFRHDVVKGAERALLRLLVKPGQRQQLILQRAAVRQQLSHSLLVITGAGEYVAHHFVILIPLDFHFLGVIVVVDSGQDGELVLGELHRPVSRVLQIQRHGKAQHGAERIFLRVRQQLRQLGQRCHAVRGVKVLLHRLHALRVAPVPVGRQRIIVTQALDIRTLIGFRILEHRFPVLRHRQLQLVRAADRSAIPLNLLFGEPVVVRRQVIIVFDAGIPRLHGDADDAAVCPLLAPHPGELLRDLRKLRPLRLPALRVILIGGDVPRLIFDKQLGDLVLIHVAQGVADVLRFRCCLHAGEVHDILRAVVVRPDGRPDRLRQRRGRPGLGLCRAACQDAGGQRQRYSAFEY